MAVEDVGRIINPKTLHGQTLGAKGAGEGGIIPVGGVIANAVAAALQTAGVQPNELPLSPPRLWRMLNRKA